jgi:hypothetical protein
MISDFLILAHVWTAISVLILKEFKIFQKQYKALPLLFL